MRFVRGVVDSADLPLNVSRETLQHNPMLAKIQSNLVNRVIKTLDEMKSSEYEEYVKFFKEFGQLIKEGVGGDLTHRDRLADLLLVESTKTKPGEFTTLAKIVEAMPADKKEIYYLIGDTRSQIENSPYLERFADQGLEVLLLTDPIDEYWVASLPAYKEKALKAVDKGVLPNDEAAEEALKEKQEQFKGVLELLKMKLASYIKDVRLSTRLKQNAAVLVAEEGAMSAHMERLMNRMGQEMPKEASKRILELNPEHAVLKRIQQIAEKDALDGRIETFGRLLLDEALIAEGSKIPDPAGFARRINDLIEKATAS